MPKKTCLNSTSNHDIYALKAKELLTVYQLLYYLLHSFPESKLPPDSTQGLASD